MIYKLKLAFVTWLGVYPTITLIITYLGPHIIGKYPIFITTLIISLCMVILMSFVIMPIMLKIFHKWLMKSLPKR